MPTPKQQQQTQQADSIKFKWDGRLIRGLSLEQQIEFDQRMKNAREVREALCKVLSDELESMRKQAESQTIYDSPNALAVVADNNGYRRALQNCIKLMGQS